MTTRDWLEEWRPTPEAPGYEASSWGRIRDGEGRVLAESPSTRSKHLSVAVKINGRWTSRQVGACVCAAFHGPRPPGHEADHRDRNPEHNFQSNLQWLETGLNRRLSIHKVGEERHCSKLTQEQVDFIRANHIHHDRKGRSARALAKRFGVSTQTVLTLLSYKTWNPAKARVRQEMRDQHS